LGANEEGWRPPREEEPGAAYPDADAAGAMMAVDEDTAAISLLAGP